jgi:predicted nucleotidyltransferase
MKACGIICEYNPFHLGHASHIAKTREAVGEGCAIVCVMSGNYVQRGDLAIFPKHARAETAVRCGADLVVELPTPYALSSAEGFASAGVSLLNALGCCERISFGSESGDIPLLREAAEAVMSPQAEVVVKEWLDRGASYASALQKAADALLGGRSEVLKSPNNLLGIEYIKAIITLGLEIEPITVKRDGGVHDSASGISSMVLRKMSKQRGQGFWQSMPDAAARVVMGEVLAGRGPVHMRQAEQAMLSRLRSGVDFSMLPGATEGLDHRFARYAISEPTVKAVLEKAKTKRYAMSRLRRMLLCACLDITAGDTAEPPPYIRILAMNRVGMKLLGEVRGKTMLPVITKPAHADRLPGRAGSLFRKEVAATDFYVLAFPDKTMRTGGAEWRTGPVVVM